MNCATAIAPLTEQEGAKLFADVWAARDGYIDVILDRSEEVVDRFLRSSESPTRQRRAAYEPCS